MNTWSKLLFLGLFTLTLPISASAGFILGGDTSAEQVNDPVLGKWKYTLVVTWDTGTQYAMSHINLMIDTGDNCLCSTIDNGLNWELANGILIGDPNDCQLSVETELNCQGDPSLGLEGIMLKFEPMETEACETDVTGQMTIVFYSDHRPAPIDYPNLALSDKFGQLSGFGNISGVFPALPCDTIATDETTWGTLKVQYR